MIGLRPVSYTPASGGSYQFVSFSSRVASVIRDTVTAKLDLIPLPSGAVFDPNSSGTKAPKDMAGRTVQFDIFIDKRPSFSLWGTLEGQSENVGEHVTLYADSLDGGQRFSATARFESLSHEPYHVTDTRVAKLIYTFRLLTEWAMV